MRSKKLINLGAGGNILPGWENYDMDLDFTKLPLPFEDGSVDTLFAEHTFEHITTHQFLYLLDDIRRVLRVGGTLRVCMPVLDRLPPDHARDIILNHGHQAAYTTALIRHFMIAAGFDPLRVKVVTRSPIDGHHKVIGRKRDDLETARIEAFKI